MLNLVTKILLHSFFSVTLFAQTPFILEQFSTAHIVVKADSNKILDKYKTNIMLKRTTQEYFKKDFIVRFVIKYFFVL